MSADKCECEEGLPEWIMSYADMITILMAFFVVMYSMAGSPDKSKEEAIFKSLRDQFGAIVPGWMSTGRGTFIHRDSRILNRNGTGNSSQNNKNSGGADKRAPKANIRAFIRCGRENRQPPAAWSTSPRARVI